jgi:hypothetical protein
MSIKKHPITNSIITLTSLHTRDWTAHTDAENKRMKSSSLQLSSRLRPFQIKMGEK